MLETFFRICARFFSVSLTVYWMCIVKAHVQCTSIWWLFRVDSVLLPIQICYLLSLPMCSALTSFRSINVDLIPIKPTSAFVVAYLVLMSSQFALNIYDNCFFPLLFFFIVAFIVCFLCVCVLSFAFVVLYIPIVNYHQARNHMSSRIQFELDSMNNGCCCERAISLVPCENRIIDHPESAENESIFFSCSFVLFIVNWFKLSHSIHTRV